MPTKPKSKKRPATNTIQKVTASRVTINSLDDLNRLHDREAEQRSFNRNEQIKSLIMATNGVANARGPLVNGIIEGFTRGSNLFSALVDGPKDVDAECGYPAWLTPDHYRFMYDREGIAKRVVDCEPEETWAEDPMVFETEDEDDETKFEKALNALVKRFNFWHHLQRIDVLSGIGQFGILLIGIDDGMDLADPIDGMDDDGTGAKGNDYELLYLRPFSEEVVFVRSREIDMGSPRYGQPTSYTIRFRDYENWGVQSGEIIDKQVHWTRVIHVADNRKISEVFGVPRMQPVWNRLADLRKIYSSAGESFWKGGFPGLAFEVNPEIADQGEPLDKDGLKKEMEAYANGLQRYIAVTGLTTKSLPPLITDPTNHAEAQLKAIAISKGIPYRVLFGSEEAKLAGDQDANHWNRKLKKRQQKYVTPLIVRPFIDRLMALGILPQVDEYEVEWPDLDAPSDKEKADIGLTQTQAIASYVQSGSDALIPPLDFLTKVLGMSTEEAQSILDSAQDDYDDAEADDDVDPEETEDDEGQPGDDDGPDDGDTLRTPNLDGSTTRPRGVKAVGAKIDTQPSLNRKRPTVNAKTYHTPILRKRADGSVVTPR